MKKIISILLCFAFLTSSVAFASGIYDSAVSRVCGVGIMGNVADGDFRADDSITRAEFTTVALRMLGISDASKSETAFSDVPSTHWASGIIAMASNMNLINGRGNRIFAPEDNVTYPEAVKIIIGVLGREATMSDKSYPNSYIAMGGSLGITKGVEYTDEPLTRAEVAALVDNALDIYPIEPIYGSDKYEISTETLFDKLTRIKDTSVHSGILKESGNLSLNFTRVCDEGYIMIGNRTFKSEKDYDEYIGQSVEIYYTETGSADIAVSVAPVTESNNIFTLPSVDTVYENDKISYVTEAGKEKFYKLSSNVVLLKNGDRITPPQRMEINLGEYLLVDNDDNNIIDVVSVTNAESFVVKSVSVENNAVYFDNNRTYHGRNGIVVDFDDDDKYFVVCNNMGDMVEISDIKAGDSVSIIGNSNDSFVKIIVNEQCVEGTVDGIEDDKVIISETVYPIGKDLSGNYLLNPHLGMEGMFVVDAFGFVIGTHGSTPDKFSYGYIADAARETGMESTLKISLITGAEPKKNVKVSNGDETISYQLQNNDATTLVLANSVKYANNPIDAQGVKMDTSNITPEMLKGKMVGYTLNSKGEINALNVYSVPDNLSSYEFNAEIFSFGSMRSSRGYIKDESTQIICVPNLVRSANDYGVMVTLTDKVSTYKVYGVKAITENPYGSLEANSEPVDVIVVKADMDSTKPLVIPADNDICIVGKVSNRHDETQEEVCTIELLNGSDKEVYSVPSDSLAYSQAIQLQKGDLIQFVTDSRNEIASIRYLASVQGLGDYYVADDSLYGMIDDIRYNVYDHFSNKMVDRISANVGNEIMALKLFRSEGQSIYMYDRRSGYIYPATSEDIMAANYYGNKASKVFALMDNNDASVLVIIKD